MKGPSLSCDLSTGRGRTTLQEGLSLCACLAIYPMDGNTFHRDVWPQVSANQPRFVIFFGLDGTPWKGMPFVEKGLLA
eukprot:3592503-Amphidinium_carterae.1